MIVLVDYGVGNLFNVSSALRKLKFEFEIDTDGSKMKKASIAIVPGVGAFGVGVKNLIERNQFEKLQAHAESGKKIVGLCLGAQMLFQSSEESPGTPGLGLLAGKVSRLGKHGGVSTMQGWNEVVRTGNSINGEMKSTGYYYFSHSFKMEPSVNYPNLGYTEYGNEKVVGFLEHDNLTAVQFHPELSGPIGLDFLRISIESKNS